MISPNVRPVARALSRLALVLAAGCADVDPSAEDMAQESVLAPTAVWVIAMENTPSVAIYGSQGASDFVYVQRTLMHDPHTIYATNFVTNGNIAGENAHPSAPNFVRMEAGSDYSITSQDPSPAVQLTAPHLSALMNAHGVSWKRYIGGALFSHCPGPNSTDNAMGNYSGDHNGPLYFRDYLTVECPHEVYASSSINDPNLARDLAGTPPRYGFIQTDDIDSGEGGTTSYHQRWRNADHYLATIIPKIQASAAYKAGGIIFVVWDETGHGTQNSPNFGDPKTGLFVISPRITHPGPQSTAVSIPSLVKTWQQLLAISPAQGVPYLGHARDTTVVDVLSWLQ